MKTVQEILTENNENIQDFYEDVLEDRCEALFCSCKGYSSTPVKNAIFEACEEVANEMSEKHNLLWVNDTYLMIDTTQELREAELLLNEKLEKSWDDFNNRPITATFGKYILK